VQGEHSFGLNKPEFEAQLCLQSMGLSYRNSGFEVVLMIQLDQ
jgi:hypothetical protein